MDPFDGRAARAAYNAVAEEYAAEFADDLARLPVDRAVLDDAAERLVGSGPVLDVGCGPAEVSRYLAARGVRVVGVDPAVEMLLVAQRREAGAGLACGDMRSLPVRSQSCAGAVAFYSVQHLPRAALGHALGEIRRVVKPGGIFVLATHLGEGEVYVDELLGHDIEPMGGTFYDEAELTSELERQAFTVEETRYRDPLPHEHPSRRIYLIASVR